MLWVWIAVVVVALVILLSAAVPLLGRLGHLRRAIGKLRVRQEAAMRLQGKVEALRQRAEILQETLAARANHS
ncbi:hypothetical protein GCM10010172_44770 [Paractinoplanes ferrugineus]|uniref:Uncharacterized protein n=1 Tax=Paractinoplanes ferrugineus TaxID=113564 RepID=A0A919MCY7_9ACTN|nr:hypothetical protein [Actinoplanes ferrugineus]GIE11208.1 hypothetical protein Afe05nite_30480 [Actinoplanes ferrugineus]